MSVIFNQPADPVLYNMIELVQRGHVVGNNGLNIPNFNVFHFRRLSGTNPGNIAGLITSLQAYLATAFQNALADAYVVDEVGGRPLDDESVVETLDPAGLWGNGAVSGDDIPTMNAASLQVITDGRGRCFRGRKHVGPVVESHTTQNRLTGGGLTLWQAAATALLGTAAGVTDTSGNLYQYCVLSRKNSILVGTGINFTSALVVDVICNEVVGSMDRRKERR